MTKCKHCQEEYDVAETQRIFGIMEWCLDFCTAQCYTEYQVDSIHPSVKFVCPECQSKKLCQVNTVLTTYPVTRIPVDGNLEYDYCNTEQGDAEVLGHQCGECGFELEDEFNNTILDIEAVAEWCKSNCSQE